MKYTDEQIELGAFKIFVTYKQLDNDFHRYEITVKNDFSIVMQKSNVIDIKSKFTKEEIIKLIKNYFKHLYELTNNI